MNVNVGDLVEVVDFGQNCPWGEQYPLPFSKVDRGKFLYGTYLTPEDKDNIWKNIIFEVIETTTSNLVLIQGNNSQLIFNPKGLKVVGSCFEPIMIPSLENLI